MKTQALLSYTPSPKDDLMTRIESIDLDPIKFKLMDKKEGQGWSRDYVDHLEGEYRKMLYMMTSQNRVPVVPNKDLDEFWHTHILDTRKYAEDCDRTFGKFVHHFPYLGMRGEEDAQLLQTSFNATKNLYEKLFGETYNLRVVQGASDCENCGSCASSCGVCSTSGICGGQGKEEMKNFALRLQSSNCDAASCYALKEKGGASDCENCGSCASSCGVGTSYRAEGQPDMVTRPSLKSKLALVTGATCDSSECSGVAPCGRDSYRGTDALEDFLRERHPEIKYD